MTYKSNKVYFVKFFFVSLFPLLLFSLESLKDAKSGECYQKVIIPPKYDTKEELIEVEPSSKKILVKNAKFKKEKKKIIISPSYSNIIAKDAKFKIKKIKLLVRKRREYFTLKNSKIELNEEYIKMVKKNKVNLDKLKVGECYIQYIEFLGKQKIQKTYIKKQAYEIIDIAPAKFKTIKQKILIKPSYTKIIKKPAIYKTKLINILVSPAVKEYKETKNGKICVVLKKAKYKTIVKKILSEPPKTKIIHFPAHYKEIEVKVMSQPPIVTRRIISPQKKSYNIEIGIKKRYFWSKQNLKNKIKTGLSICKKELPPKFKTFEVYKVDTPATTKKIKEKAKYVEITIEKKIKDANTTTIILPSQYQIIKTKVLLSPSKIYWKKVDCNSK